MEPNRILVTGATGFVGRRLVEAFGGEGRALTLAMRRGVPVAAAGDVRRVAVGEIGPETAWDGALREVRDVVHLAAHVHVAPERALHEEALFDRVNRAGSLALFDAAARTGVRRFVYVSSATVLGSGSEPGRPFEDADPLRPDTPYARSKVRAEAGLAERAAGVATGLVILRPPLVCGSGVKGNLASLMRLARSPLPLPLGGVRNRRTLVSLDNLVDAIRAVLDAEAAPSGPFLLGDAAPVSTSDIVAGLREGFGRPPGLLPAPVALARRVAAALGREGAATRLFGDMEIDSSGFRSAFDWRDVTDTRASLVAAARAAASGRP